MLFFVQMIAWNTKDGFRAGACCSFVTCRCQRKELNLQLFFAVRHIPDWLSCQVWLLLHRLESQLLHWSHSRKEQAWNRKSWERLLRTAWTKWKCCSTWTDALKCMSHAWCEVEGGGQVSAFSCRAWMSFRKASLRLAKWCTNTALGRRNNSA